MRRRRPPPTMEEKRHRAWQGMLTHARYTKLKVHRSWMKYESFVLDVDLPPAADYALRRYKPAEGFIPGNVVWARQPLYDRRVS